MPANTSAETKFEYNHQLISKFLDVVFHTKAGEILTWAVGRAKKPGLPVSLSHLMDKTLKRASGPLSLYYGTSSARVDPEDGRLKNKKAMSVATHVIVLDDIGTKVLELPEGLRSPTYIIESSKGNYQYGYVLKVPIDDIEIATTLVMLLYQAGISDGGGATANKLVRLPDGINGKHGERGEFHVQLTELNDNPEDFWTPEELLLEAGLTITWAEVREKGKAAIKRNARPRNLTPWSPITAESPNLDGSIDPVLEWLYGRGDVQQELGEWVEIRCPWGEDHSNDDPDSGYSPLGRGEGRYEMERGFHCFHDHCKTKTTRDFLEWVAASGGPEAPVRDVSTPLHTQWAWDASEEKAYNVMSPVYPVAMSTSRGGLKTLFPQKTPIVAEDGKVTKVSVVDMWVTSPHRIVSHGIVKDPTTESPLTVFHGHNRINLFKHPVWPAVSTERRDADITVFLDFLTYLVPDETERTFFLNWLGAKVQSQAFRGPALLMMTPTQGTGRTTLGHMIQTLLGVENTATLTYEQLTGAHAFNDWQLSTLVICNEVFEGRAGGGGTGFYKSYERLKGLIEFQPSVALINTKNRPANPAPVFTSYVLFSNHLDALPLEASDRRIYAMSNALIPRKPEFFAGLNDWLQEKDPVSEQPLWAASVTQWLRERPVDVKALLAPAPVTNTKLDLIADARSGVDHAIDLLVGHWSGPYISTAAIVTLLTEGLNIGHRLGVDSERSLRYQVQRSLNRHAWKPRGGYAPRVRLKAFGDGSWLDIQHTVCVIKGHEAETLALQEGTLDLPAAASLMAQNGKKDVLAWLTDELTAEDL